MTGQLKKLTNEVKRRLVIEEQLILANYVSIFFNVIERFERGADISHNFFITTIERTRDIFNERKSQLHTETIKITEELLDAFDAYIIMKELTQKERW